jgi:hypothetical protein
MEGWLVTLGFAALAIVIRRWKQGPRGARYLMGAAFLVFALLKGSAPGGAGARADFDAARAAVVPA